MAKFKDKTECIGTMCLMMGEGQTVPVMELHSKLEWVSVVDSKELDSIMSGERGQLAMIANEEHHRNVQRMIKKQKIQLLWLAIKNLFK